MRKHLTNLLKLPKTQCMKTFLILISVFMGISAYAENETPETDVEEITINAPYSRKTIRRYRRLIYDIIDDNGGTHPQAYHRKLLHLSDFEFENNIRNLRFFPEVCERLHPHNIEVANRFKKAGWHITYAAKNFDTDSIRDYHKSVCEAPEAPPEE